MKSIDVKIFGKSILSIGSQISGVGKSTFKLLGGSETGDIEDKKLLQEGYMSNSDVYSIITLIAEKASEVNFLVKDKKGELVEDGLLFYLVNDSRGSFNNKIEEAVINYLSTGDLFWRLLESEGFSDPTGLEVLRSESVEIVCNTLNIVTGITYSDGGFLKQIPIDQVIHTRKYNPKDDDEGNHRGLSPLKPGRRVLTSSNNREIASSALLKNLGVSGLISDKSQSLLDEEERKQVKEALRKNMGGPDKSGEYTIIGADVSVHQLGMSSKDLEISKSGPDHLRKMASIFHVSSRFFNDPQGSTYNNAATDAKNFFKNGPMPVVKKICRDLNAYFASQGETTYIDPDFSNIEDLQEDQAKVVEKNKSKSEGIREILTSQLSKDQKIFLLVDTWGMNENQASKLVGDGTNGQKEDTGN